MWDGRLRQYLAARYDSRKGAFDWDLSMKLHELHVSVVTVDRLHHGAETCGSLAALKWLSLDLTKLGS